MHINMYFGVFSVEREGLCNQCEALWDKDEISEKDNPQSWSNTDLHWRNNKKLFTVSLRAQSLNQNPKKKLPWDFPEWATPSDRKTIEAERNFCSRDVDQP